MEDLKRLFYKIFNHWFRWYDILIYSLVVGFAIMFVGDILGDFLFTFGIIVPMGITDPADVSPFLQAVISYGINLGIWVVLITYLFAVRPDRPILRTFWTKYKGNTVFNFILGLLIGGGMNLFCAVVAMINKDIAIYFDEIQFVKVFVVFIMVFFQSGSEELICRGFLYQRLRRSYKNPWVAIIGNSLIFACLHLANPGITILSFLNILLCGVLLALMIYYFDSMWMAIAFHTAWNYMQSIVLGLPNSGLVFEFSIFNLDLASATNSFAYDVNFGIEGTILSSLVLSAGIAVIAVIGNSRKREQLWVWGDTVLPKKQNMQNPTNFNNPYNQ